MKNLFKKDQNNNELQSNEQTNKKHFSEKRIIKKVCKIIGLLFIGFIFGMASVPDSYTVEEYDLLSKEKNELSYKYDSIVSENKKLKEKVEQAKPWFEMKEEEQKAEEEKLQAQKEAEEKAEAQKIAAEKKAKEEEEAKEKAEAEAKEKQGYETGITYSQLARTPDDYLFEKVKFSGKVIQVMEGTDSVQIRLAVGGNYDNIILGEYTSDIVKSRVLEDDYITIYGFSAGLITYESTMGGNITIPSVVIDKINN